MIMDSGRIPDWEKISQRVEHKQADLARYSFSHRQMGTFTIFFDLAQEFDNLDDLLTIAVVVPHIVSHIRITLYLLDENGDFVCRRCLPDSENCPLRLEVADLKDLSQLWTKGDDLLVPIRCNQALMDELPVKPPNHVLGFLWAHNAAGLSANERLFYEKYANRVGFQIHNKFINAKNREHLDFIQSIAHDIGHNVIVPNMYFKLLFRKMNRKILDAQKAVETMVHMSSSPDAGQEGVHRAWEEVSARLHELNDQYRTIYRHFKNSSLFLESLLRQSHFEQGRYVLVKRLCNFKTQIIEPQLGNYKPRLDERGIAVDTSMGGVPDESVELVADIGLLSQVFANLFSNAVKYTREVCDHQGKKHKFVSYGWEWLPDYFGPGQRAIKINVFSTGPHVPDKERERLFEANFRGETRGNESGSGHGLFFVKQIVELHGGRVGYSPTPMGNDFFIILPAADSGNQSRT